MVGNTVAEFVAKLPGISPEEQRTVLSDVIQSEVGFARKTKRFIPSKYGSRYFRYTAANGKGK